MDQEYSDATHCSRANSGSCQLLCFADSVDFDDARFGTQLTRAEEQMDKLEEHDDSLLAFTILVCMHLDAHHVEQGIEADERGADEDSAASTPEQDFLGGVQVDERIAERSDESQDDENGDLNLHLFLP